MGRTQKVAIEVAANFEPHTAAIALVAGTGSTARLLDADGTIYCAGGHGHLIGDGGSGYYVAQK